MKGFSWGIKQTEDSRLFFSSPRLALRAPREISRSPRLAHKAPVMQTMPAVFLGINYGLDG